MDLLHFKNGDRIIAYIYDDRIKLKLVILKEKEIVLYDDTQLYLRDIYTHYLLNKKMMTLDDNLKNANLGIMLNTYYYRITNDIELDKRLFHLDSNGDWFGTRYACFENNNIATWIFFSNERFYFKCTPLYEGLFNDYFITYKEFIRNYREEYINDFSCDEYREFMHEFKKMILAL